MNRTEITEHLIKLGASVYYGHQPDTSPDADVVVVFSGDPFRYPEILAAHTLKIPVIRGAEMLAEIMRMKFSVAVSGTRKTQQRL